MRRTAGNIVKVRSAGESGCNNLGKWQSIGATKGKRCEKLDGVRTAGGRLLVARHYSEGLDAHWAKIRLNDPRRLA